MKKEKGITLIALAITIVVLLILAGVTISGITGENGIIGNAKEAKKQSEIGAEKEIIDVSVVQAIGDNKRGNLEKIEYENRLKKNSKKELTNVFEDGEFLITEFVNKNRFYQVDKEGNVEGPIEKIEDEFVGDITKGGSCDGTPEKPYEINCIEDLVVFSIMSNGGNDSLGIVANNFNDKYVVLNRTLDFNSIFSYNDSKSTKYGDLNTNGIVEEIKIELTNKAEGCIGFTPIGKQANSLYFDGKNNMIKNIYQNSNKKSSLAPFVNAKEIKNLSVSGTIINKYWHAAGICTNDVGICNNIYNCNNYANIIGYNWVGGIISAMNGGKIYKCKNYGNIKNIGGNYLTNGAAGIVCSIGACSVEECANEGTIEKIEGQSGQVGGIVSSAGAEKEAIINNCINKGKSNSGILDWGKGNTKIINCVNLADVEYGIIKDFTGSNWDMILKLNLQNCYNLGNAKITGIIGRIGGYAEKEVTVNINNCYNAGNCSVPIINKIYDGGSRIVNVDIKNCYYDKNKSTSPGEYTIGITAMNETEMKNNQTFIDILNNNIGANAEWRRWKVGENGYPTFE